MDELHCKDGLVLQMPVRPLVGNENRRKHLHGKQLVAELPVLRKPDRPHPARAELTDNFIPPGEERILAPRQRHAVVYRLPNTIPISIYHNVKLFAEIAQAKISSKALHSVQREVITCWGSYRTTIWPDFASIFASTD